MWTNFLMTTLKPQIMHRKFQIILMFCSINFWVIWNKSNNASFFNYTRKKMWALILQCKIKILREIGPESSGKLLFTIRPCSFLLHLFWAQLSCVSGPCCYSCCTCKCSVWSIFSDCIRNLKHCLAYSKCLVSAKANSYF